MMIKNNLRRIPGSIWAIGFVSLFMDLSSELIHAVLPMFMVATLGASMTSVGFIEGISEAVALIARIFSGTISDYLGKRKLITVIGYSLGALTKPLFPMADGLGLITFARFTDRIGKGIRGAPRDALVGDLAPAEIRGECFGLRQTLDTIGALLAPLAAIVLMIVFSDDMRAVMWVAVIPAVICVAILVLGVKEPERKIDPEAEKPSFKNILAGCRNFNRSFWIIVIAATLLTMARFSDAFLILKAQSVGMQLAYVPVVLVVMNFTYAFSSYPVGIISDRMSREKLLIIGIIILVVSNLILAFAESFTMVIIGTAIWGLHMGFTQGLLATMVTDKAPLELRGSAYGIFNLVCGIGLLVASVLAGILWDNLGSAHTFMFGAVIAICAIPLLFRR